MSEVVTGQCCRVGNTASECRLGLVQEFDVAGDLQRSRSSTMLEIWEEFIMSIRMTWSSNIFAYALLKPANIQRKRINKTRNRDHEDHIAERGFKSLRHHTLAHKAWSHAPNNDNSGCESRRSCQHGKGKKVNKRSLRRHQKNAKQFIFDAHGLLLCAKLGTGTEVP